MSKSVIAGIVIAIIVIAGGGVLLATRKTSNDDMSNMDMNTTTTATNNTTPSGTAATQSDSVTIQNFAFSPDNITVKKGTTVTWTNKDATAHTVTENDSQTGPASGDVGPGKTYSFTYNTAGTFKYHCSIHPTMTGTVTVTD